MFLPPANARRHKQEANEADHDDEPHEVLQIGETTTSEMRPGDALMVQKLGEADLNRRSFGGVGDSCYGHSYFARIGINNAPPPFGTAGDRVVHTCRCRIKHHA